MDIKVRDIVLCEFFFSDFSNVKKRPILVFKVNLPFDDFIGIPISSKTSQIHPDEILLEHEDFENGSIPCKSKIMIRKTFVISRKSVSKIYGTLNEQSFKNYHQKFCEYFECCTTCDGEVTQTTDF